MAEIFAHNPSFGFSEALQTQTYFSDLIHCVKNIQTLDGCPEDSDRQVLGMQLIQYLQKRAGRKKNLIVIGTFTVVSKNLLETRNRMPFPSCSFLPPSCFFLSPFFSARPLVTCSELP